ncbi:hypothetical protein AOCH_007580 [Aspergillus ochraceoroseus]|uniref:Septin-type G domain-containing protein n=1 Tax=Aspergillus ochraceoroseus TaxID=138278 RepID=A0A0F8UT88_9EURO|nr:hypothetical protein AOCH_007580 [Aspergillus ochraceoroseus]
MRPPVPEVAVPRSRKSSLEQQWIDPRSAVPSTFYLARSHGSSDADADELSPDESDHLRDSMYGVQSFEGTGQSIASIPAAPQLESDPLCVNKPASRSASLRGQLSCDNHPDEEGEEDAVFGARRKSTLKPLDPIHPSMLDPSLPTSTLTSPRPSTPLNFTNPDEASSLPSSPRSITNQSLRHLDEISITDDLSSQAVASGEEDEESRPLPHMSSDSMSQLIMPSISMPSRRPFTDKGMALGRLKILFAGPSGSGKTSFIKSIVQICEDIVHVDPFDEPAHPLVSLSHVRRSSRASSRPTPLPAPVSEIYASSKPYPTWWSDLEDSRVLRRRKSMGEIVLERNLCFVDTPASRLSQLGQIDAIIQYMNQQLFRATAALETSNNDFQNMLAGNGGCQVDVILYLISQDTLRSDIECISKLGDWTNVIPVISKSDLLTPDQISALKSAYHDHAQTVSLRPFSLFGDVFPDIDQSPFAVSSAKSNDDSIMDASTLMSPDYVQPLVHSELTLLVQRLFDRENVAWIRHSAAKKVAQQHKELHRQHRPLQNGALSFSSSPYGLAPGYTMARISDYTQREEKLARIQLARWASDLQQSLQNERERYAAVARGERAVWLTERLGECVVEGSLVPISQTPGFYGLRVPPDKATGSLLVRAQSGQKVEYHIARISPLDPLGVVRWSEDLKRRGWAIVQIVGSFGVVGGLALWLAKAWGLPSRSFSEWRFDWFCTSD